MNRFSLFARLKLPVTLASMLATLMSMQALAALPGYMVATGETQGVILGSVTLAGREDQIEVVEFGHSISQAIDNATGSLADNKQHRPIRLTKPIDRSTPALMKALTTGETLSSVVIRFWRQQGSGQEVQFYTVELHNATIANISQSHRAYDGDDWSTLVSAPAFETLTLSYQSITWTWEAGEITAEDEWAQGNP